MAERSRPGTSPPPESAGPFASSWRRRHLTVLDDDDDARKIRLRKHGGGQVQRGKNSRETEDHRDEQDGERVARRESAHGGRGFGLHFSVGEFVEAEFVMASSLAAAFAMRIFALFGNP